jgi:hypothetical protein
MVRARHVALVRPLALRPLRAASPMGPAPRAHPSDLGGCVALTRCARESVLASQQAASAVYILDMKGKVIIARNYRGDVPMSVVDHFARHVQVRAPHATEPPPRDFGRAHPRPPGVGSAGLERPSASSPGASGRWSQCSACPHEPAATPAAARQREQRAGRTAARGEGRARTVEVVRLNVEECAAIHHDDRLHVYLL